MSSMNVASFPAQGSSGAAAPSVEHVKPVAGAVDTMIKKQIEICVKLSLKSDFLNISYNNDGSVKSKETTSKIRPETVKFMLDPSDTVSKIRSLIEQKFGRTFHQQVLNNFKPELYYRGLQRTLLNDDNAILSSIIGGKDQNPIFDIIGQFSDPDNKMAETASASAAAKSGYSLSLPGKIS